MREAASEYKLKPAMIRDFILFKTAKACQPTGKQKQGGVVFLLKQFS